MNWTGTPFVLACTKHEEKAICACGKNTYCETCGFGQGAIPCYCSIMPEIEFCDKCGTALGG